MEERLFVSFTAETNQSKTTMNKLPNLTKWLAILVMLMPLTLVAQRNISGIVKNTETGERLPFAAVSIKGTNIGSNTNVDGYFSLLNVTTDSLRLEVSYVGYGTIEKFIAAGTNNITDLVIEMSSAGVELNEITVNANSFKIMNASEGISTVQLSTEKLSLLPNVGEVDIFRSLQLMPGVSSSNESSSGLFVRGGTPDQNLVLFDGMTVYNVDHFFGFFSAFNADAVKDVQLYKGAFPARYGGRLSGVVDLTGKTGSTEKFSGNLGMNLLSTKASVQVPIFGKASLLVSGRRSYTDIIQSPIYESIFNVFTQSASEIPIDLQDNFTTVEPSFYFYDFNTKLSIQPTQKDVIAFSFYNGKDNLTEINNAAIPIELPGNTPDRAVFLDINELSSWGNQGASAKWSRQWNAKWYSNILFAYSRYFSNYDRTVNVRLDIPELDSTVFERDLTTFEDNNVVDLSFRWDNEIQLNSKHKLEIGVWATRAAVDFLLVRDDTLTILNEDQQADYLAAYVSENWQPTENITLHAGIRATYYGLNDKIYYAPRFSGGWKLTDDFRIKTGLGRHFQFVNRVINESISEGSRDFWLLADDELVKVSRADHYVIGGSYNYKGFVFDIEAYYKHFNNLAEFSLRFQRNDTDVDELFFNGDGYARGTEFLIQKTQGQYTGWVSYTLAEVTYTFPDFNDGNPFPALHDTRHEFKMVHSYEANEQWTFAATWIYASGKPFTEPDGQYTITMLDGSQNNYISVGVKNGSRLPAYHRLDISATSKFKVGDKIDGALSFSIFNLYGRRNVWYREYDFSQTPPVITDIQYLGFTPNVAVNFSF